HRRDRDAQHAAGGTRLRPHGVLPRRRAGGGRAHRGALHIPGRRTDRGLHHGKVRMSATAELAMVNDAGPADAAVRVDRFSFWYGDTRALHEITLDIPRRAITAFIGPSGCGKSTLLRSIN